MSEQASNQFDALAKAQADAAGADKERHMYDEFMKGEGNGVDAAEYVDPQAAANFADYLKSRPIEKFEETGLIRDEKGRVRKEEEYFDQKLENSDNNPNVFQDYDNDPDYSKMPLIQLKKLAREAHRTGNIHRVNGITPEVVKRVRQAVENNEMSEKHAKQLLDTFLDGPLVGDKAKPADDKTIKDDVATPKVDIPHGQPQKTDAKGQDTFHLDEWWGNREARKSAKMEEDEAKTEAKFSGTVADVEGLGVVDRIEAYRKIVEEADNNPEFQELKIEKLKEKRARLVEEKENTYNLVDRVAVHRDIVNIDKELMGFGVPVESFVNIYDEARLDNNIQSDGTVDTNGRVRKIFGKLLNPEQTVIEGVDLVKDKSSTLKRWGLGASVITMLGVSYLAIRGVPEAGNLSDSLQPGTDIPIVPVGEGGDAIVESTIGDLPASSTLPDVTEVQDVMAVPTDTSADKTNNVPKTAIEPGALIPLEPTEKIDNS